MKETAGEDKSSGEGGGCCNDTVGSARGFIEQRAEGEEGGGGQGGFTGSWRYCAWCTCAAESTSVVQADENGAGHGAWTGACPGVGDCSWARGRGGPVGSPRPCSSAHTHVQKAITLSGSSCWEAARGRACIKAARSWCVKARYSGGLACIAPRRRSLQCIPTHNLDAHLGVASA